MSLWQRKRMARIFLVMHKHNIGVCDMYRLYRCTVIVHIWWLESFYWLYFFHCHWSNHGYLKGERPCRIDLGYWYFRCMLPCIRDVGKHASTFSSLLIVPVAWCALCANSSSSRSLIPGPLDPLELVCHKYESSMHDIFIRELWFYPCVRVYLVPLPIKWTLKIENEFNCLWIDSWFNWSMYEMDYLS